MRRGDGWGECGSGLADVSGAEVLVQLGEVRGALGDAGVVGVVVLRGESDLAGVVGEQRAQPWRARHRKLRTRESESR